MKILFGADFKEAALVDMGSRERIWFNEISLLSQELLESINSWNDQYQEIIPLEDRSDERIKTLIECLDREGVSLSLLIMREVPGAQVTYFSEGLLKKVYL